MNNKSTKEVFGLREGQEITWRCELRGGYGRIIFVKGKVIKLNPKKCRIEAQLAKGGVKQTNVDYANIQESMVYTKVLVFGGERNLKNLFKIYMKKLFAIMFAFILTLTSNQVAGQGKLKYTPFQENISYSHAYKVQNQFIDSLFVCLNEIGLRERISEISEKSAPMDFYYHDGTYHYTVTVFSDVNHVGVSFLGDFPLQNKRRRQIFESLVMEEFRQACPLAETPD